jgi:predicted nucleic acid-binding protein
VLYPPSLRDLLLTLAAVDAFEVVWSDEILAEVERNVVADHPDIDPVRFRTHTIAAMRRAFPDAVGHHGEVNPTVMAAVHPGDRHVVAVAVGAAADVIVTVNLRHFPPDALAMLGIGVATPGDFVGALDAGEPEVMDLALEHLSSRWTNPRRSVGEILDLLSVHPSMAPTIHKIRERRGRDG